MQHPTAICPHLHLTARKFKNMNKNGKNKRIKCCPTGIFWIGAFFTKNLALIPYFDEDNYEFSGVVIPYFDEDNYEFSWVVISYFDEEISIIQWLPWGSLSSIHTFFM